MKRYLPALAVTILLAGCAAHDEEAAVRLDEQAKQVAALQQAVADAAKAAQAPRAPTEAELARDQKLATLEAQLADTAARLARLEQSLAKPAPTENETKAAEAAPATPPPAPSRAVVKYQNKPPLVSVYNSPDTRAADFITTPTGSNPDFFPVAVRGVVGRKVVTGTHPTTKLVETEELYKDDFGRERKRMKEVTEQVSEYGYEVSFSLENLTRTEKVIACTAGETTRMLTLQPGEKRDDVVVRSSLGASLRIESGSDYKRFSVTY
jgi:Flp pilus assembly protein TadG